jgi:hypothetical protein
VPEWRHQTVDELYLMILDTGRENGWTTEQTLWAWCHALDDRIATGLLAEAVIQLKRMLPSEA